MNDFGGKVSDSDFKNPTIDTSNWDIKFRPSFSKNTEKEYVACLCEVMRNCDG